MVDASANSEPLVTPSLIEEAMNSSENPLAPEPFLWDYLNAELLRIAGRLAMKGTATDLVQEVTNEMYRLLSLTVGAVRLGYRGLWEDVLPRCDDATPSVPPEDIPF